MPRMSTEQRPETHSPFDDADLPLPTEPAPAPREAPLGWQMHECWCTAATALINVDGFFSSHCVLNSTVRSAYIPAPAGAGTGPAALIARSGVIFKYPPSPIELKQDAAVEGT